MTNIRRTRHTLPEPVHLAFGIIRVAGDTFERDEYIRALRAEGWTLESVAQAAGVTRERVRQIVAEGGPIVTRHPVPHPPLKPAPKPRRTPMEPTEDTLARLLELQPEAERVRANAPRGREAAEEYTRLLNHARTVEGVTIYHLSQLLGRTPGALKSRLVRYGYMQAPGGTSKVYQPIRDVNRIGV